MYELYVSVKKVMGECTADPPMKRGDYFTVRDGDIRIPEGGFVCVWALQNLLPLLPAKERAIAEEKDQDWMWRVHHAQCPDPDGRVIFEIEQTRELNKEEKKTVAKVTQARPLVEDATSMQEGDGVLRDLRIVVEEVKGKCTSGMLPGDHFTLRGGRLYIPAERHFCLYALQAVLPFLAAKQRRLEEGDWLKDAAHVICPDPAGNVVLRIEAYPQ